MTTHKSEWLARAVLFLLVVAAGFIGTLAIAPRLNPDGSRAADDGVSYTLHANMPENGGWSLETLRARAGQPIHLRMTSDDVLHTFAVGQSDADPIELRPGEWTETTLTFDRPGRYTYYCTAWCGRNHWRMRGIIEVEGEDGMPVDPAAPADEKPLYLQLKLDLDAPHPADVLPAPGTSPDSARGAALITTLQDRLPAYALDRQAVRATSPSALWLRLRAEDALKDLPGDQLWDITAALITRQTTPAALAQAAKTYAVNCAACHGETGRGDGVMVEGLPRYDALKAHEEASAAGTPPAGTPDMPGMGATSESGAHSSSGSGQMAETNMGLSAPPDFTNPSTLLGAAPALIEGKLLRGGMGTGMPYWGPIFTEEELNALIVYLYSFAGMR